MIIFCRSFDVVQLLMDCICAFLLQVYIHLSSFNQKVACFVKIKLYFMKVSSLALEDTFVSR